MREVPKGVAQDHSEGAAFGQSAEIWTMWHVSRFMEACPHASYEQIVEWMNGPLHWHYPPAIVTPMVEQHVVKRLAERATGSLA